MDTDQARTGAKVGELASRAAQTLTDESDDQESGPGDDRPDDQSGEAVGGQRTGHRALKLVLTLRPAESAGYHALVAVGSDACDPLLRSVDVVDVPAALQEVASLAAEAEARWQTLPRNPSSGKKSNGSAARQLAPKQPAPEHQPLETETHSEDSNEPQAEQLKLFG